MIQLITPKELNGIFVHKKSVWVNGDLEIVEGTVEGDVTFLLLESSVPTAVCTNLEELKNYAISG